MENFNFQCGTNIIFGKDSELTVGQEVKKVANKVLLVYGGQSAKKSGLIERITQSLKAKGIEWVEISGVQPNPRLSLVKEGIALCRQEAIQFILAVGGGSAIDTAKGIALGVPYQGDVWDFYIGKATPQSAIGVGVVLTIPAAGSESSIFTVVSNEEECLKIGYGSELIRPVFAIMNPELSYSIPKYHVAAGSTDIMMHTLERYFTNATDVDLTDRLCEGLLKTMLEEVPRAMEEPTNYAARAEIMWAGSLSHNGLMDTGRIGDFASHEIEHELGAIYDIIHGAGLAVIFPAWCKYVYQHDVARFVQFAVRVMNVEQDYQKPEETALAGIRRLEEFFVRIGMPTRLSQLEIGDDRWEEMADKCTGNDSRTVGSFVPLRKVDILNIFALCK